MCHYGVQFCLICCKNIFMVLLKWIAWFPSDFYSLQYGPKLNTNSFFSLNFPFKKYFSFSSSFSWLSWFVCICIIWYNIKVVRAHFPWNNLYSPGIFNDNDVDFILLYKMEHQIDFFLEKGLIRKQLHHYLSVENSFCKARNRILINTTRHAEKNFVFKF